MQSKAILLFPLLEIEPRARRYFSVSANQREWRCIALGDALEVRGLSHPRLLKLYSLEKDDCFQDFFDYYDLSTIPRVSVIAGWLKPSSLSIGKFYFGANYI